METGIIQDIKDNKLYILVEKKDVCESCAGNKLCSTINSKNKILETTYFQSQNINNFTIGDKVIIEFKPKIKILSSIIIFLFPLLILIAFYYIGFFIFKKENISIIMSFAGFILYFIIIFFFTKSKQSLMNFNPIITKTGN